MDIVKVQDEINERIKWLEALCKKLDDAGKNKADAIANYDVTFAVSMAKLARGQVSQIEGEVLPETIPATCLLKYAAGMCKKERGELEIATNGYKSLNTKIESTMATLNAKQSIFRHLSHEVR